MKKSQKIVLVTGVAGFLGQYISRRFFDLGWHVVGIDMAVNRKAPLSWVSAYHQVKLPGPVLSEILKSTKFDVCIHCAGSSSIGASIEEPVDDFYSSTVVTFELLNSLRLFNPGCRFVFLSSAAVYGNPESLPVRETYDTFPLSPYGFHKLQSESLCREFYSIYGLNTASARIFSAYGPGLRRQVIWDICQKALTQDTVLLQGTGEESRDFIHASDVANAIACIATNADMKGDIYNVASGNEVTIHDLAKLILSNLSCHRPIKFDGRVPVGVPHNWCSDITKIKSLGFNTAISLDQGILGFTKWAQTELHEA